MKATKTNGQEINITFPSSGIYHQGKIKIDGQEVGWWCENCEDLWHAQFTMDGKVHNVWCSQHYGKNGMVYFAQRLINKGATYSYNEVIYQDKLL